MRVPKSISPSALASFEKDKEEYYFKYICENRPPRTAQSQAASVGSAFDAVVKANLIHDIYGDPLSETFMMLFETQVEPQNRDFAIGAGHHVMDNYEYCGAYAELLTLMDECEVDPKFEFDADIDVEGIPIIGKPDCRFVHKIVTGKQYS